MANFYIDNEDLRRSLASAPLEELAPLLEAGFRDAATDPSAPADAASYRQDHEMIAEMAGALCAEEIAPHAAAVDVAGARLLPDGTVAYAPETAAALAKLAESGLTGLTLPRRFEGMGLSTSLYTAVVEMVSRGDASLMTLYALQSCGELLAEHAPADVAAEVVPALATGRASAAMGLTEPQAGSALGSALTRAEPVDEAAGRWALTGEKCFVTNGGARYMLALGRTEPGTDDGRGLSLFLLDRQPGIQVVRLEEKMGLHGSPTAMVHLAGAEGRLLGRRGRGLFPLVLGLLHAVRLEVGAQAVGIAQAAQAAAVRYSRERQQFHRTLDRFAPIRAMLLGAEIRLRACRAVVFEAAFCVDRIRGLRRTLDEVEDLGEDRRRELRNLLRREERRENLLTPFAKYASTEMVNTVCSSAIQVHGGYGYCRDYPVERLARDARITSIYEGTSQIQVGAVIDPLLDGGLPLLFDDMDRDPEPPAPLAGGRQVLRDAAARLGEACEALRERREDRLLVQLHARDAVDGAVDLLAGRLLLRAAAAGGPSEAVARVHLEGLEGRNAFRARRISRADRHALDSFDAALAAYD